MILAIPQPSEVIENLDAIKEWLIFLGLVLAVLIGIWTLGSMAWKAGKKALHRRRNNDE